MTLEGKNVLKEGWVTLFKSKKPTLFSHKAVPNKQLDRAWAVVHQFSSKGPFISFYQDNRKETRVMKREKIELFHTKAITRMVDHPKHPHCFTLKFKGSKCTLLNLDTEHDLDSWLKMVCELLGTEYKREKVIWEYLDDGGLWQALADDDSYRIEAHYCEQSHSFHLGDAQLAFHYNLNTMVRSHPRTKHNHRIKRTAFIEERPEVLCTKMADLPAIWEWGDASRGQWHPFERETNIQIEDMYDSGSQWAELTLCLPSPMPFLLDLHDMKLVNFRTAVRHSLRRIDNSDNIQQGSVYPEARSPSPDDFEDPPFQQTSVSPLSPIFKGLQDTLQHLQFSRKNITYKQMLGEGAFGEVHLAEVSGLPGHEDKTVDVAVKQLRLSDFIARHGHHSQQMEDFLREAKEMSKLDHPRVVKIMAVCTLDYPLLLIEEYMNQSDLLGVLKDSRPSMPLTLQLTFAYHVADGMHYLAVDLNCVHRDLAARNILVHQHQNGDMVAKIADFGLSRHLYSEMYKHQTTKPRPLPAKWMSLESLMYFIFTTKSDVWSYGVLLWEIMTLGRSPYPGVENRELLEQIEEKGLKLGKPHPCPDVIYNMTLDCIQHDPEERPNFTQIKERTLEYLKLAEEGKLVCSDDGDSLPNSPATTKRSTAGSQGNTTGSQVNTAGSQGNTAGSQGNMSGSQGNAAGSQGNMTGSQENTAGSQENSASSGATSQPLQPKSTQDTTSGTSTFQASLPKKESPQPSASLPQDSPQPSPTNCATPTKSVIPPQESPKGSPRRVGGGARVGSCSERNFEPATHSPPTSATSNGPLLSDRGSISPNQTNDTDGDKGLPTKIFSKQDSLTEMTPQGHVYYLLDPLDPTGSGLREDHKNHTSSIPDHHSTDNHSQAKGLEHNKRSGSSSRGRGPKPAVPPKRKSNYKTGNMPAS